MLRDVIGTFTSIVGLIAMLLHDRFALVLFDALGALVAAVLMAAASLYLMTQARELIAGRALPDRDLERVRSAIAATADVDAVNQLAVVYSGTSEVVVDADLDLTQDLTTTQIEAVLDAVELQVRAVLPETEQVRVLLNSPDGPMPANKAG